LAWPCSRRAPRLGEHENPGLSDGEAVNLKRLAAAFLVSLRFLAPDGSICLAPDFRAPACSFPRTPKTRSGQIGEPKRHFFNGPRVHFMRNAFAHAPKAHHSMVSAAIRSFFGQDKQAAAAQTWCHVDDQPRPRFRKLAALMDEAEADVIAFMAFPRPHWPKLDSTNPIERVKGGQPPRRRHLPHRSVD
jgi:Transposase, Mutator family